MGRFGKKSECEVKNCSPAKAEDLEKPDIVGDKGEKGVCHKAEITAAIQVGLNLYPTTNLVKTKLIVEGSFCIYTTGGRDNFSTVKREGIEVGADSDDAKWWCKGSASITGATETENGFQVVGNGASFTSSVSKARSNSLKHGPFKAAGVEIAYMKNACTRWAKDYGLRQVAERAKSYLKVIDGQNRYNGCNPKSDNPQGCACDPSNSRICYSNKGSPYSGSKYMCLGDNDGVHKCWITWNKGKGPCHGKFSYKCGYGLECVGSNDDSKCK